MSTLATLLAAGDTEKMVQVLLVVVLGAIGCVGIGAAALVLRVILPGVAGSADASLARLSTARLLLTGILPLVGMALIGRGLEEAKSETLEGVFVIVVGIPLVLGLVAGLMACLPYLGGRVLKNGEEASPLARASVGGLVVGLSLISWGVPPLGLLVSVLLAGWFLGTGLGGLVRKPRAPIEGESTPA